jgi:peptidoglycan/LPS O-acetylase OafA/YrhL
MAHFNISALTGFRFLAAFLVLIGHGYGVVSFDGQATIGAWLGPLASCGMSMFFVLSGFLMWLNYGELYRTRASVEVTREFAVARFARLYPMLFCTLLLPILFHWRVVRDALPAAITYLLMMNDWHPGFSGSALLTFCVPYIAHTWSISAECFCYLLFPVAALILCRVRSRIAIVGSGLSLVALLLLGVYELPRNLSMLQWVFATNVPAEQFGMWLTYYSPVTRIFEFGIGCVTAKYFIAGGRSAGPAIAMGLLTLAVAISIFANGDMFSNLWVVHDLAIRAGFAAGSALLIYGIATDPDHPVSQAFSLKLILIGGEISYSTYLLHPFILGLFMHRSRADSILIQISEMVVTMLLSFAAIYSVAYMTYRFIEVPARRSIKSYVGVSNVAHVLSVRT